MANELIINASLPETRIALMEDGEIQELLIERASGKGIVGNIYKGRVTRVLPGMQAAFVDIGLEKAAFLYVDDVYVHSEIWEEDEGTPRRGALALAEVVPPEMENESAAPSSGGPTARPEASSKSGETVEAAPSEASDAAAPSESHDESHSDLHDEPHHDESHDELDAEDREDILDDDDLDEDDSSDEPVGMGPDPEGGGGDGGNDSGGSEKPEGTVSPANDQGGQEPRKRHRRGRRGGRFRRKGPGGEAQTPVQQEYPENYHEQVADAGKLDSDRSGLGEQQIAASVLAQAPEIAGRPETSPSDPSERRPSQAPTDRAEFKAPRSRDRRIRQKTSSRPVRAQVNIQDLLKEGQEVLVQVAKDPIATKGARLTCHISLPGRHLVCMPTIDHVGVSRRIDREEERRRLREFVERNRPRNLGFIVRTASGKQQSEKRIKQDIEYLTRLWNEIKEKAGTVTAPALVYEDLNSVLRAIRDWVTEDIDKVIVDSRYHYNEIQRFVSHFMPSLKQKVDLYHGDIPIFDAYGISTELSRALERKVWLKSGGYIVVDQAEALVAIDVNTGRYVGKKNLEDTILKTNLEAVQEIAYQLRLRNCGGIIILDLIDMEKDENKQRVYRALEDALLRDRARPSILKISELGLIEMTRKRTRDTIVRTLCESCSYCEGKGFIKGKQTVAYEVMREIEREGIERVISKVLVQAHPDVIDILAIDERESLDLLERRYRKQIYLQAVTDFHPEQFEVTADKRERSERSREFQPQSREHREHSGSHDSHSDRNRHHRNENRNDNRNDNRNENRNENRNDNRNENRNDNRNENRNERHRHEASNAHSDQPSSSLIIKLPPLPTPLTNGVTGESQSSPIEPPSIEPSENSNSADAQDSAQPNSPSHYRGSLGNSAPSSSGQDGFDEEDRLAFLRAQAAQDAALARLNSGGAGHSGSRNSGDSANRGDRNSSRRPMRGRRGPGPGGGSGGSGGSGNGGSGGGGGGGKFRGRNDRNRGPKNFGYGSNVKRNESPKEPTAAEQPATVNTSGEGSGGGSSGGGGGGTGGDHSQPPV